MHLSDQSQGDIAEQVSSLCGLKYIFERDTQAGRDRQILLS